MKMSKAAFQDLLDHVGEIPPSQHSAFKESIRQDAEAGVSSAEFLNDHYRWEILRRCHQISRERNHGVSCLVLNGEDLTDDQIMTALKRILPKVV